MSTEAAAEAVTETVQAAAKPIAFIATVIASAAVVGFIVRKLGRALPTPDYVGAWQNPTEDTEEDDE